MWECILYVEENKMEPYLGEIKLMAINFAPAGWLPCDGRSLPVQQNTALYSLIGYQYGGSGANFNLPDLRGRVPVHKGGVANGIKGGSETITLTSAQVPAHMHLVGVCNSAANKSNALSNHIAAPVTSNTPPQDLLLYGAAGSPANLVALSQSTPATNPPTTPASIPTVSTTGAGLPHDNMQPWLALNYFIATSGLYPQHD